MRPNVFALSIAIAAPLSLAWAGLRPQDPTTETVQEMLELTKPGPAHQALARVLGDWKVEMHWLGAGEPVSGGTATGSSVLGNRFFDLDVAFDLESMGLRYTLGFDRRHREYTITLIDTAGTYAVHARGTEVDGLIRMGGIDDDPRMRELGFEKKFVFDLRFEGDDTFEVVLHFVDTREETEPLREAARYRFTRQ